MGNYSVWKVRVEGRGGYPDDLTEEERFSSQIEELFPDSEIHGPVEFILFTGEYDWPYDLPNLCDVSSDYPLLVFIATWYGNAGCGRVDAIIHNGEATIKTIKAWDGGGPMGPFVPVTSLDRETDPITDQDQEFLAQLKAMSEEPDKA